MRSETLVAMLVTALGSMTCDVAHAWCNDEMRQAETTARRINEAWPLRPHSDPLHEKITLIGHTLLQHANGEQSTSWYFRVIRNLAPYAYAVGGRHIYVTDGTANFVQNESELAAVVAHEIGHQLAGHFCKNTGLALFANDPAPADRRAANQESSQSGPFRLSGDSEKEQEADAIAVELLAASGYDPGSMLGVAQRLPSSMGVDSRRVAALKNRLATFHSSKR